MQVLLDHNKTSNHASQRGMLASHIPSTARLFDMLACELRDDIRDDSSNSRLNRDHGLHHNCWCCWKRNKRLVLGKPSVKARNSVRCMSVVSERYGSAS